VNQTKVHISLGIIILALIVLSLGLGSVFLPINNWFDFSHPLIQLRATRTVSSIFAGAGISLAGLLMQTLFRNPLAGPSVLGISSGASLGVVIALALFPIIGIVTSKIALLVLGISGAVTVLLLIILASKYIANINTLLIVGLMIGYFASAVVGVISFYTDKSSLQAFVFWGLGGFDKELQAITVAIYGVLILLLTILSFTKIKVLDTLLIGEEYARAIGVNTKANRLVIITIVGILTGVITVWCGPIAFLGIAVPHLARQLVKTSKHYHTIIATLLIGGGIALCCDIISRVPGRSEILPLNAITSFIGAPIVVWILFKNKSIV